jgi:hypothetical protein
MSLKCCENLKSEFDAHPHRHCTESSDEAIYCRIPWQRYRCCITQVVLSKWYVLLEFHGLEFVFVLTVDALATKAESLLERMLAGIRLKRR